MKFVRKKVKHISREGRDAESLSTADCVFCTANGKMLTANDRKYRLITVNSGRSRTTAKGGNKNNYEHLVWRLVDFLFSSHLLAIQATREKRHRSGQKRQLKDWYLSVFD